MGSFRGNCEILEVEDEQSTTRWPQASRQVRGQDREQKPPIRKKGSNNYLEDDINKLFEAVNLRTSKSLDLSDSRRNASKKPMRATGSHSPVIGFSEPVSLKQALRGLCISQAAEMAAVKRWRTKDRDFFGARRKHLKFFSYSVSVGSRFSGEVTNTSSIPSPTSGAKPVINIKHSSRGSGQPPAECSDVGLSLEEGNIATSSTNMPSSSLLEPTTESLNQNSEPSPLVPAALAIRVAESSTMHNEIGPALEVDKQFLGTASVPSKDSATSLKVVDNAAPKLRRKSRLQTVSSSSLVKGNRDVSSTRNTYRAVKPVIRNKNLIIKKSKKVAASTDGISETSFEVNSGQETQDHISGQFICQRCQCSLRDTRKNSDKDPPDTVRAEF
ncbi:UNVERIFIED_CONTAM: Serine/threonine-protein kinase KIPK2 [Sesamum radiatum]|uniref:Serine/threonine-protein kinase KIPK2 n=1 Tax=Sesamum radiatum TaxID=300843 RepID=A0AAW2NQG1_SESRA